MAKLRGAKKAAFLRRMARGRAKHRRGGARSMPRVRRRRRRNGLNSWNPGLSSYNPSRRRRPRRVVRRRFARRRNPMAVIANPGYSRAYAAGWEAAFGKRRRKKRKGTSMAKRRRKRRASARRASPRRRVHRRRPSRRRRVHRRRRGGGGHFAARVRRGTKVIYINGRRRRGHRRRRRNPGMGGLLRRAFVPYAVGFVTSGAMGVLDAGLANYPMGKNVVKVLLALGVAYTGRRHPVASTAAIAAIAASQGYAFGTRLSGGLVASTPAQAVQGLGEMSRTYPEMGALLNGGVGALLNGPPDIDDAVVNYATALNNMASEDD